MPNILVVDDAKTMRDSVRELLTANGLDVIEAENGEQGIEMMGLHAIDMVITDLNMPGMDGLTMCEQFKLRGYHAPIFMLTTQSNPELKAKAKEFGVLAWIIKPHKDEVLLQGVRKVLKL